MTNNKNNNEEKSPYIQTKIPRKLHSKIVAMKRDGVTIWTFVSYLIELGIKEHEAMIKNERPNGTIKHEDAHLFHK